jgi:hypothetical protein
MYGKDVATKIEKAYQKYQTASAKEKEGALRKAKVDDDRYPSYYITNAIRNTQHANTARNTTHCAICKTQYQQWHHNSKSTPHITHHTSRITHHASRITHHASRITHHAPRTTHHTNCNMLRNPTTTC